MRCYALVLMEHNAWLKVSVNDPIGLIINSVINFKTDKMKTTFKLLTGLFYLPFLAIAFIMAVILFILEMTVMFTYNQSIEWKGKMIMNAGAWVKKLK